MGETVELAVLDCGPGLPPGGEQALFERFTRLDDNDRTGLGLAIVKGFAAALSLRVTAANRPDGGAAFTIAWPAAQIRPALEVDET